MGSRRGISEGAIKQLTILPHMLLLHTQHFWPEHITTLLWPVTLCIAADQLNHVHTRFDGNTSEIKFSQTTDHLTRRRNFHTGGCLAYILDIRLQDAGGVGPIKWDPQSELGIYQSILVAILLMQDVRHLFWIQILVTSCPQLHVVFSDNLAIGPSLYTGRVLQITF